jgi:DNA polymerase III subunit beta
MNINCNRELFLNAVNLLTQIIPQKPQSRPILSNVICKVEKETLNLKATDLELGININIPLIKVYEEGEILLPAYQLLNILREATTDDIKMEVLEKTAIIKGSSFQYKLPVYSNETFPEVPELEGKTITLDTKVFHRLIKEVAFAMNKDKNRYSLNSLLLCLNNDTIETVATDQIRLAYSKSKMSESINAEETFIFPSKAVTVLTTLLSSEENDTVDLVMGKNQVTIKFKNGYFITRLVDAQFVNYRDAYKNFKDTPDIILNTEKVSHAIRQVMLLTCENAKNIALFLENNKIIFKANTPLGEGTVELDVEYDREEMMIGINPWFVQDFLKEINNQNFETIRMKIAGPKKPVILSPHDDYLYFMSPTSL